MKTAYTEYRVVITAPELSAPKVTAAPDERAAEAVVEYFTRHGLTAHFEARDVSEWRRAEQ